MIEAIFLDFYGTVVHEDGDVIKVVTQEIFDKGIATDKSKIGIYWWNAFQTAFINAFGDTFRTQRELEYFSLKDTIDHFHSLADAEKLSELMFVHWVQPPAFADSKEFFEKSPVPIYIVSNIDRADILKAIAFHGFNPAGVFTSEDAKAYKPRKELFELALRDTGLNGERVVHIGDSLSSDVQGAKQVGINALWLNRNLRGVPAGVNSIGSLLESFEWLKVWR